MPATDDIRDLQAQIVTLRLQLDQQASNMASLVDHIVRKEVSAVVGDRLPTAEVTRWATEECVRAAARKKDYKELFMHSMKLGVAATGAFFIMAMWEALKARLGK